MYNFKTKFQLEGLLISIRYHVVITNQSEEQIKWTVVRGFNNNINRKIDCIVVTKIDKDDDWERIHIFTIEKVIEVSNKDDLKHWKKN